MGKKENTFEKIVIPNRILIKKIFIFRFQKYNYGQI